MLLRSVGLLGLRTPHTGALRYEDGLARIPSAAIPIEDADRLQRLVDRKMKVVLRLRMEAQQLPDAPSANLVAEWRGRERPEEIVLIGGHIDSWDVGTGAMDDGGGSVVAWEAARLMKSLDLRPRRTVRVVLFTNEENGLRGGLAYRDLHQSETHVAAIESDSGVFKPSGFGFTGSDAARAIVKSIATLLQPIGAGDVGADGGGADIGPLAQAGKRADDGLRRPLRACSTSTIHHTPGRHRGPHRCPRRRRRPRRPIAVMAYVVASSRSVCLTKIPEQRLAASG